LADELRLESANSPFTENGSLTPGAVEGSELIVPGRKIGNKGLWDLFGQRGGVEQWGKYRTALHQSPYGNFRVHYYRNSTTGEILYNYDYKVKFTKG
jgi:hypothetical protein